MSDLVGTQTFGFLTQRLNHDQLVYEAGCSLFRYVYKLEPDKNLHMELNKHCLKLLALIRSLSNILQLQIQEFMMNSEGNAGLLHV